FDSLGAPRSPVSRSVIERACGRILLAAILQAALQCVVLEADGRTRSPTRLLLRQMWLAPVPRRLRSTPRGLQWAPPSWRSALHASMEPSPTQLRRASTLGPKPSPKTPPQRENHVLLDRTNALLVEMLRVHLEQWRDRPLEASRHVGYGGWQ